MAILLTDNLTDNNGTALSAHAADTGQTITVHEDVASILTINANRAYASSSNNALHYYSLVPATPDYEVLGVLYRLTDAAAAPTIGVAGRINTTQLTYYLVRGVILVGTTSITWELVKFVNTVQTVLDSWVDTEPYDVGDSVEIGLRMVGDQITGMVRGVARLEATDTSITAAGRAGIKGGPAYASATIGVHLDSLVVRDPVAAPTNTAPPAITTDGSPEPGETVTASTGSWDNSPGAFAYQWNRGGVPIDGATSSSYTLLEADNGEDITVTVTATNVAGSDDATSAAITPSATPRDYTTVVIGQTALTGTLAWQLYDLATGSVAISRRTTGVIELGATGVYRIRVDRPVPGTYALLVDRGTVTPAQMLAIPYVVPPPVEEP